MNEKENLIELNTPNVPKGQAAELCKKKSLHFIQFFSIFSQNKKDGEKVPKKTKMGKRNGNFFATDELDNTKHSTRTHNIEWPLGGLFYLLRCNVFWSHKFFPLCFTDRRVCFGRLRRGGAFVALLLLLREGFSRPVEEDNCFGYARGRLGSQQQRLKPTRRRRRRGRGRA